MARAGKGAARHVPSIAHRAAEKNFCFAELIRRTAGAWKRNKAAAFFRGALIVAMLASAACVAAFEIIGSHLEPDGTLVEPFGFIPLAWLFALPGAFFALCLPATRIAAKMAARRRAGR